MSLRAAVVAVVLVGVVATAAGCEGRLSAGNACRSVQLAQCHFQFQCCTAAERQQFGSGGGIGIQLATEADCVDLGVQLNPLCVQLGAVAESVESGRFRYDEARAEECLGPLIDAAYACDPEEFFARQQAQGQGCRGAPFFGEGTIEGDGACQLDAECAGGGRCERTSTEPDVVSIDGTCTATTGDRRAV